MKKTSIVLFLALAMALAACGANTANQHAGEAGGTGGEGGVEAALVTYADAAQGFSIGHPGTWTQDTTFTSGVKFVGGDDYMTLEFVTPSPAAVAGEFASDGELDQGWYWLNDGYQAATRWKLSSIK